MKRSLDRIITMERLGRFYVGCDIITAVAAWLFSIAALAWIAYPAITKIIGG